jgi:hypothetical protein
MTKDPFPIIGRAAHHYGYSFWWNESPVTLGGLIDRPAGLQSDIFDPSKLRSPFDTHGTSQTCKVFSNALSIDARWFVGIVIVPRTLALN